MKEDTDAEKVFWAAFFSFYLAPNAIEVSECHRLAAITAGRLSPGAVAVVVGRCYRRIKQLDPGMVKYIREGASVRKDCREAYEEAIRSLTALPPLAYHEDGAEAIGGERQAPAAAVCG